jgi:NodT family efflux transporter outer membrane factor (OMF) lipoprotein
MERVVHKPTLGLSVAAVALLMAGCAVGPDYHRPAAPETKGYTSVPLPARISSSEAPDSAAQQFVQGMDIPAQWWTLFHSPSLNRLVERALKANPNLAAAQAALRQAQEDAAAAEGALFPSINANASGARQKISGAQFGHPNDPGTAFTLYNASISVSYGLDIFGAARRALEALGAEAEFERFQMEGTYLTLASNVVTTAIQEASLRAQVAATKEIIDVESQQLDMLQKQFDVGGVALSSVLAQKTALAQTRAALPLLEKQLALIRNSLTALTGKFASEDSGETFDLETMQLPQDLPVSLPSRLVEQRPDIRASESLLHAASAQIGVATAAMFPEFTINGGAGSVATEANKLFSTGSGVWNIGANIAQPLFRGGTLTHQRRAAIDAYDAAAAQYRATVLAGFLDVANVLDALQADAAILQAQTLAAQSAAASLDMAKKQYGVGGVSYLTLLNAEQSYQQTRIALAQAQGTRFADSAALFQALGGGWWNRESAAAMNMEAGGSIVSKE